jgi:hypothetical protein
MENISDNSDKRGRKNFPDDQGRMESIMGCPDRFVFKLEYDGGSVFGGHKKSLRGFQPAEALLDIYISVI